MTIGRNPLTLGDLTVTITDLRHKIGELSENRRPLSNYKKTANQIADLGVGHLRVTTEGPGVMIGELTVLVGSLRVMTTSGIFE